MDKKIFSALLFCILQLFHAQQYTTTNKTKEMIKTLLSAKKTSVSLEVDGKKPIKIFWSERENSIALHENIKTFVGYSQGNLVATISIKEQSVFGNLFWEDKEWFITSENGFLAISHYGSDDYSSNMDTCGIDHHNENDIVRVMSDPVVQDNIKNDDILRVYRLALPISYHYFTGPYMKGDIQFVKQFWANVETTLNEIYTRDLGIRFKVVNYEKLILKNPGDEIFDKNKSAEYIINFATRKLDSLIGETNYDLGCWISNHSSRGVAGLAYINNAYLKEKAASVSTMTLGTISHEIGHLFGGRHTYTVGGDIDTDKTELQRGQSVMSYGFPRDFFSLLSIQRIRKNLVGTPYYSDEARTQKVNGTTHSDNIPYGIKINTQAPKINQTQILPEYRIPKDTYFQFNIPATDSDSKNLYYTAHQTDIRPAGENSIAKFMAYKPSRINPVKFQEEYSLKSGNKISNSFPEKGTVGIYTFWLGVSDALDDVKKDFAPQYDLFKTKVHILEGEPFKITSNLIKTKFKGNDKYLLTWSVDKTLFDEKSRVRILLSDDFGKTYKHILAENIPNTGSYEITLPNIDVKEFEYGEEKVKIGAGVIKIEVENHIAYALTNIVPYKKDAYNRISSQGGFTIRKDETLSTQELNMARVTIYPNPVKDDFEINGLKDILSVEIFDETGKKLKTFPAGKKYSVTGFPKGVYMVSVRTLSKKHTFKILKH